MPTRQHLETETSRRAAPLPPSERRQSIVAAAMPLVLERGSSVTSRDLAAAAGVSEGTLFKVFDDKDALIRSVVESAIDQQPFEQAVAAIDPSLDFREQLVEATTLIQRRVVGIWKLVSQVDADRHVDPQHQPLPDSPALAALFADDDLVRESPADAARILRSLTLALTHPLMANEPKPAAAIVTIFLDGVGT